MEIELRGVLPTNLQASAVSGKQINLSWRDNSDDEEGFSIERADGGYFSEIAVVPANEESYQDTTCSPLRAYTYRIRTHKGDTFSLYSDHVIAITMAENGAPAYASQPVPADGSKSVSLIPILGWLPGAASTSHDIYLGTSDPPPFIQNQTDSVFTPGALEEYTTYYWQINELNSSGTTIGDIWSFTTEGSIGMVAHWNMDENSGSVLPDVAGYSNNGTLINMSDEAWVPGIFGNALQFDGVDDYIMVPHDPSIDFTHQDFSISFWLRQSTTDKPMTYIIKGTHTSPGTGKNYEVAFIDSSNSFRFNVDDNVYDPADMFIRPDWYIDTVEWYHIVAFRNTELNMLYVIVNTEPTGMTEDNMGDISQNEDLYIGVSPDEENTYFKGSLDDIRIYNYALSIEEIQSIYDEGITKIEDNDGSFILKFDLRNNPNPFKEKTTIIYSLTQKEKIKISVYDLLGREVEVITDQMMPEGKHLIEFDGSKLFNGTYICILRADSGMKIMKMMRIK